MRIKPGCLCLLRDLTVMPEWNGRTVTAVRFNPSAYCIWTGWPPFVASVWEIAAPWLPLTYNGGNWQVLPSRLIPLSDPDADLTADYPETLEDRLREYTG